MTESSRMAVTMMFPRSLDSLLIFMVTAILLLSVMLSMGLAVAPRPIPRRANREPNVNANPHSTSPRPPFRRRPSSWGGGEPGPPRPYPLAGCPDSGDPFFCPDAAQLMRSYNGAGQVDFGPDTAWTTHVLDDADPSGNPVRFWKDES